jgi:hypothetical protein
MSYLTPFATTSEYGVVQVGSGISVANGVISTTNSSSGTNVIVGTWTPTITSSAVATITVVATTANYSKIGQQVTCYFDITVAVESGGSGTGALSLGNLPFTSIVSTGYVGSVIVSYFENAQSKETTITGSVIGNSTRASLWNAHEVFDITCLTQDDIQATTRLQGTVIYLSAA